MKFIFEENETVPKKIGDIANFKRGYDLPAYNRVDGIYPVVSSAGISGYHNEYKCEGEGLVTGRYGTLGEFYYINGKYWAHNTALYVTDFKGNYPKYVYFLMKSLTFLKKSDKSTVPGIDRNDLHEFEIPFIEETKQIDIANALFTIESRIELNKKINTELESMAKIIYGYWFDQFDFPNEEGKPYKTSGGEMEWNEELKREIPVGWEAKPLSKFGEFKNGINYEGDVVGDKIVRIVNVRDISDTTYFILKGDLDEISLPENDSSKYLVHENDILIARSGTPGATRLIHKDIVDVIYCGFIIRFNVNNEEMKKYLFFKLKDIEHSVKTKSGGTILKNVSQDTLKELWVAEPKETVIKNFNSTMQPLFESIYSYSKQNQELIHLRDFLLPLLMNGQVKVK